MHITQWLLLSLRKMWIIMHILTETYCCNEYCLINTLTQLTRIMSCACHDKIRNTDHHITSFPSTIRILIIRQFHGQWSLILVNRWAQISSGCITSVPGVHNPCHLTVCGWSLLITVTDGAHMTGRGGHQESQCVTQAGIWITALSPCCDLATVIRDQQLLNSNMIS